jgi:hypothetical protein
VLLGSLFSSLLPSGVSLEEFSPSLFPKIEIEGNHYFVYSSFIARSIDETWGWFLCQIGDFCRLHLNTVLLLNDLSAVNRKGMSPGRMRQLQYCGSLL